jgi:SAM-dependent methyltransferase
VNRRFASQYGALKAWHWWFRGRQRILESVIRRELGGRATPRRIASLGCGPAEGLRWLQPLAGAGGAIVGIDRESMHAARFPDKVRMVIGRVEETPLASASFDLVVALDVLEHLDDDAAGLREAMRLVRHEGLLLVTVPALPSLWGAQDVVSEHRRRYTRRTLQALFARVGLPPPRLTYYNTLLFPAVAGVRWSRRLRGNAHEPHSDFAGSAPGLTNEMLFQLFAAERFLVNRVPLPIGVSLLASTKAC